MKRMLYHLSYAGPLQQSERTPTMKLAKRFKKTDLEVTLDPVTSVKRSVGSVRVVSERG